MQRVVTILMAAMFVGVVIASEWDTGPRVMTDDEARATVGGQRYKPCGPCARVVNANCKNKGQNNCGLQTTHCTGQESGYTCCEMVLADSLSICPNNSTCDGGKVQECWDDRPTCQN